MTQESLQTDILIIGAGPAGLCAAIRLKQLNPAYHICLLEKASRIGGHILSGAILDPRALNELLPDWQNKQAPVIPANTEEFLFLTPKKSWHLPLPKTFKNHQNYIVRLSNLCQWLSNIAENLGVEIFTGFTGSTLIFDDKKEKIIGIETGSLGLDKKGQPTARFQKGIQILAKHTLLAEGCRGSLSQQVIRHFQLNKNKDPQTYGLGIKEIWQVDPSKHQIGKITHTIGYPLDLKTYGGGFVYHIDNHQVALGFVVGLDYINANLDPFQECQKFKTHPDIQALLQHAKRVSYGAKTLVEGGLQSLPQLNFPGGLLIGDAAGFLNVAKLKGIHTAMKSGMCAAEAIAKNDPASYFSLIQNSWVYDELYRARNVRPSFKQGLIPGIMLSAIDQYLFQGKAPWTLHHSIPDHLCTATQKPLMYPKPDNQIVFDKPSSLALSNIHHNDNQPSHLKLKDAAFKQKSYTYCPANVYEIHDKKLVIHAQNCLHCKACDIKDEDLNITWTPPEGGSGPDYAGM